MRHGHAKEVFVEHGEDPLLLSFGIAVGVEFCLNFGAAGPFPEFLFFGLGGFGELESEALLFDGEAGGTEFAAAQGHDEDGEITEMAEGFVGADGGGGQVTSGGGVANGNPASELIGQIGGQEPLEFGIASAKGGGKIESLLAVGPIAEGVITMIGEVLLGDRSAVEALFEDGLGFGEGVKPGENGFGGLAVLKPLVQFVLDVGRQGGDFSNHISKEVLGVECGERVRIFFWFKMV
jgi:hypothetical protein